MTNNAGSIKTNRNVENARNVQHGAKTNSTTNGILHKDIFGDKARVLGLPWSEKYRPKSLRNVAEQDSVVRALMKYVEPANVHALPHLMFCGPPGTGKTTVALALVRALFSRVDRADLRSCVLFLNASDERGIAVVRNKIKTFAAQHPPAGAPFRMVILDECDYLTPDAQAALRLVIEPPRSSSDFLNPDFALFLAACVREKPSARWNSNNSGCATVHASGHSPSSASHVSNASAASSVDTTSAAAFSTGGFYENVTSEPSSRPKTIMTSSSSHASTRFILMCNYASRVIEPVVSRCSVHRFAPIRRAGLVALLRRVARLEHFACPDDVFNEIERVCAGDVRAALNLLQSVHSFCGALATPADVCDLAGDVPLDVVRRAVLDCTAPHGDFETVRQHAHSLTRSAGYPAELILRRIVDILCFPSPPVPRRFDETLPKTLLFSAASSHASSLSTVGTRGVNESTEQREEERSNSACSKRPLVNSFSLTDLACARVAMHVAESERALLDGANPYLQILRVLSCIYSVSRSRPRHRAEN